MKSKKTSVLRHVPVALTTAVAFALSSSAYASTIWDGGGASPTWGTADNWSDNTTPAFNNTTDLSFPTSAVTNFNTILGFGRTIRSLTFGADVDTAFGVGLQTAAGGATGANLTFDTDAVGGNASITIASGSTGNITIGNVAGGTNLNPILADNLVVDHNGSGVLLFNRPFQAAAFGITKTGTGTMQTNNNNLLTGALHVNGGTFIANTFGDGADMRNFSSINLGGGTIQVNQNTDVGTTKSYTNAINATTGTNSKLAFFNSSGVTESLLIEGVTNLDIGTGATLTVQNISSNTTLVNAINITRNVTGTGAMIVETYNNITFGADNYSLGRVLISGDNTGWSGNLTIAEGTAVLGGTTATSGGTGDIVLGETGNSFGAGLSLGAGVGGGQTLANDITVRSGGFRSIKGSSDNTYTLDGNITLEGDLNVHNGLFFTDKRIILNGNISGVGGLSFTESGNPDFIRMTGDNTYTGATTIGAGVVLNNLSASGNAIGDSSAVTFDGAGSTLVFNSTNETIGSLASAGTDGTINLGANTLTTGGNDASTSFGGGINGTGGNVTKVGIGTMTFTGANTYTGTTTVSEGTLALGAAATLSSSAIQIAAGATLDTSALAGGLVIASGNRIGGDGSITGGLSLDSGALLVFSLTSTLDVSGTVTLDNSFSLASLVNADGSAIDWSFVPSATYTLINNLSDFSNISDFGPGSAVNIGDGRVAYFDNGSLQLVVVPEPSTWALITLGLASMVVLRRRRKCDSAA